MTSFARTSIRDLTHSILLFVESGIHTVQSALMRQLSNPEVKKRTNRLYEACRRGER